MVITTEVHWAIQGSNWGEDQNGELHQKQHRVEDQWLAGEVVIVNPDSAT